MLKLKEKHKEQRSGKLNLRHSRSAKYNRLRERGVVGMVKGTTIYISLAMISDMSLN